MIFKPFIQNRKREINILVPQSIWRFIPGDNPGDMLSRGNNAEARVHSSLWLYRLTWLKDEVCKYSNETDESFCAKVVVN